jgi:hypothetical protein
MEARATMTAKDVLTSTPGSGGKYGTIRSRSVVCCRVAPTMARRTEKHKQSRTDESNEAFRSQGQRIFLSMGGNIPQCIGTVQSESCCAIPTAPQRRRPFWSKGFSITIRTVLHHPLQASAPPSCILCSVLDLVQVGRQAAAVTSGRVGPRPDNSQQESWNEKRAAEGYVPVSGSSPVLGLDKRMGVVGPTLKYHGSLLVASRLIPFGSHNLPPEPFWLPCTYEFL